MHTEKKKEREDGEGHWAANEGERDISRDIKTLSRNICVGNGGGRGDGAEKTKHKLILVAKGNPSRDQSNQVLKPGNILRQVPHHPLKSNQGNRIRWKSPHDAGHESPPVATNSVLSSDSDGGLAPVLKSTVLKRVRHDALFDHIGWIREEPE